MSTTFPTSLQDLDATRGTSGQPLSNPNHITHHQNEDDTIEALQAKVGIDNSAVTTSLDYKLKSSSSVSPGHKHTLTATDFSDVVITSVADGNVLTYQSSSSKWINSATSAPDASTSVKGVTTMSVAPASASTPIAVGDNDPRVPTQGENNALVGNNTDIAVGTSNKFVTQTGLQKNAESYAVDSVGTDSYAITLSPVPTSYAAGMTVRFKAGTANTAAATINVNSLGAKTIKKNNNEDLQTGDIESGQIVTLTYDGTDFQMQSPVANSTGQATFLIPATPNLSGSAGTKVISASESSFVCRLIPYVFSFSKISLNVSAVGTSGTVDIALYTEDGQTKIFEETTGTISGTGVFTHTLGATYTLKPGNYYFAFLPNSTTSITVSNLGTISSALESVSGEPIPAGKITGSPASLPATFNPVSDITADGTNSPLIRLDT